MGAISDPSSIPILNEFLADSARCVRETCEIAISKIQWDNSEEGKKCRNDDGSSIYPYVGLIFYKMQLLFSNLSSLRKFTSVDPAPATSGLLRGPLKVDDRPTESIEMLRNQLTNKSLPLFNR